jgi:hypothetical protein
MRAGTMPHVRSNFLHILKRVAVKCVCPEQDFDTETSAEVGVQLMFTLYERQTFVRRNGFGKLNCMKALLGWWLGEHAETRQSKCLLA